MSEKNFVASRRVQAAASAGALMVINGFGLTDGQGEIVQAGVNGAVAVFGLLRLVLHFAKPDKRKLTIGKPRDGFMFVAALGVMFPLGCATPEVGGGIEPGKGVNVSFKFCTDPSDPKHEGLRKWTFGLSDMSDALFGCRAPEAD